MTKKMYGNMMLDSGCMCRSTNGAAIDGVLSSSQGPSLNILNSFEMQ